MVEKKEFTLDNLRTFAESIKEQIAHSGTLEKIAGISRGFPDLEDEMVTPGSLWFILRTGMNSDAYFVRIVADEDGNKSVDVLGAPYNRPRINDTIIAPEMPGEGSGGTMLLSASDGSAGLTDGTKRAVAGRFYDYMGTPAVTVDMLNTIQLRQLCSYNAGDIDPAQDASLKVNSLMGGFNLPQMITLYAPYSEDSGAWADALNTYPEGTVARYADPMLMSYRDFKVISYKRVGLGSQLVWEDLTEEVLCATDSGSLELITPQENSNIPSTTPFTFNLVEAQKKLQEVEPETLTFQMMVDEATVDQEESEAESWVIKVTPRGTIAYCEARGLFYEFCADAIEGSDKLHTYWKACGAPYNYVPEGADEPEYINPNVMYLYRGLRLMCSPTSLKLIAIAGLSLEVANQADLSEVVLNTSRMLPTLSVYSVLHYELGADDDATAENRKQAIIVGGEDTGRGFITLSYLDPYDLKLYYASYSTAKDFVTIVPMPNTPESAPIWVVALIPGGMNQFVKKTILAFPVQAYDGSYTGEYRLVDSELAFPMGRCTNTEIDNIVDWAYQDFMDEVETPVEG